jgi:hypothetical protein
MYILIYTNIILVILKQNRLPKHNIFLFIAIHSYLTSELILNRKLFIFLIIRIACIIYFLRVNIITIF